MNKYRIIATDLDGTLLNSDLNISIENMNAMKELSDMGVHIVPSSGRSVCEMPKELIENPDIRYIIHSNGAAVYDKVTEERITMNLPHSLVLSAMDILSAYDAHIMVRYNGDSYVDKNQQTDEDYIYYNICRNHCEVIRKHSIYTDDFDNFIRTLDNAEMFAVFFHSDEDRKKCKEELEATEKFLIAEAFDYNVEIFAKDAGKGNALHKLADKLGIDYSDTIAVGDSLNDITMIEDAGLGIVMKNANDTLKSVADEIACNNDEHIMQWIKSHYFN